MMHVDDLKVGDFIRKKGNRTGDQGIRRIEFIDGNNFQVSHWYYSNRFGLKRAEWGSSFMKSKVTTRYEVDTSQYPHRILGQEKVSH